jgi:hypothetical protein
MTFVPECAENTTMKLCMLGVLAITAASGLGFSAYAQPKQVSVADGAMSFTVPSGWVLDSEPGFELYVEQTLEDESWARCAVKTQSTPLQPGMTQETINARLAQRKAADFLPEGAELLSFSVAATIGPVLVLEASYLSKDSPNARTDVRQYGVAYNNKMALVHADCVSELPEDPAFRAGAETFLGSSALNPN